jgi:hypothetical protein
MNKQLSMDPSWLTEFANFLEQNNNKKQLQEVKEIFVETFMDNIRDGMDPKDALHNAKVIALGFIPSST